MAVCGHGMVELFSTTDAFCVLLRTGRGGFFLFHRVSLFDGDDCIAAVINNDVDYGRCNLSKTVGELEIGQTLVHIDGTAAYPHLRLRVGVATGEMAGR